MEACLAYPLSPFPLKIPVLVHIYLTILTFEIPYFLEFSVVILLVPGVGYGNFLEPHNITSIHKGLPGSMHSHSIFIVSDKMVPILEAKLNTCKLSSDIQSDI